MDVILLEDVKTLGKKGQIVKINDGYARNYVLPKKLGIEATAKNLNDLKLARKREEKEAAEELAAAKELAAKIKECTVTVSMKTGEGVLLHCHTIALYTGSPECLSHTTVVSRWLVIPIEAISDALAPTFARACLATSRIVDQISSASCSTQPGFGKYCVNSFCAILHISPLLLKRIQRLLVVPASRAIMYFAMLKSPLYNFLKHIQLIVIIYLNYCFINVLMIK